MYGSAEAESRTLDQDRVVLDEVKRDPLDILLATVLSQATSDRNSARTYRALKERFSSWEEVMKAPVSQVEEAIREGGLSGQKAGRIKEMLQAIFKDRGWLSLDFLKDWDTREVFGYLTSFKGVGAKTAACVLLFGLGRPSFPVDTHVFRVMRRLGMAKGSKTPGGLQAAVEGIIPRGMEYDLHINLIRHGRRTCGSRTPRCGDCALRRRCEYGKKKAP
jgi:endonuclease-3